MELKVHTPENSLILSIRIYIVIGCLAAYWGFTFADWPPPPAMMMVGIAGVLMVVTAAPAVYARTPKSYWMMFVGNVLAGLMGIIFEIGLFRRMGMHVALIYPFGLPIFGIVGNVHYLLKPKTRELFGIVRPAVKSG